ncbi:MAG: family clan aspartic protease [Hyphomicrobiales bacterium]|nr:family clan aspartic protease [Hyphomicrobiales bacterium]
MNGPLQLLTMTVFLGLGASYVVTTYIDPARKQGAPAAASQSAPQAARAAPTAPRATGSARVEIPADASGQFHARVEIEGRMFNMLVDTGATFVSLTHEDALALGLRLAPSDYTLPLITANGELRAARTNLRRVRIDTISAGDVPAIVLPRGASGVSLLGMSFLKTVKGIEVASGTLVMRP